MREESENAPLHWHTNSISETALVVHRTTFDGEGLGPALRTDVRCSSSERAAEHAKIVLHRRSPDSLTERSSFLTLARAN